MILLLLLLISHFSALAEKYSTILEFSNQQEKARLSYLQFTKFLTIEHVPRITDFCICIYVFGSKLNPFRLCDSALGITQLCVGLATFYLFGKELIS